MTTRRARARSLLFIPAIALLAGGLGAETRKISPSPERGPSATVWSFQLAADGGVVVYDQGTTVGEQEVNTIFAVSDGGPRVIARIERAKLGSLVLAPDGRTVVYLQTSVSTGGSALYAVPVDGSSAPRRLSPPPEDTPRVGTFALGAKGRVVFTAGTESYDRLYSAPLSGRQPALRLDGPMVAGGYIASFQVSPDGLLVSYVANQEDPQRFELFLAPAGGGAPARKLNPPVADSESVLSYRFAPTSERIVFLLARHGADRLHSAAVHEAAPPVQLSVDAGVESQIGPFFQVSPDGTSVVYVQDASVPQVYELFRAPIKGHALPQRLNPALVAGGEVRTFAFVRDGSVVYTAEQEADEQVELFHVARDGAVRKLNAPLVQGQDVTFFQLAPDGRRALYVTDRPQATFLATLDGSIVPVVLPGAPSASQTRPFIFSPGGERILFLAGGGIASLLLDGVSVPLEILHGEPDFRAETMLPGLAGERLLAYVFTGLARELFTLPLAGGAAPERLSAPLPMDYALDDAWTVERSPDDRWAVFTFGPSYAQHLYSVDLVRRTPAVRIDGGVTSPAFVSLRYWIAPDSRRVLFRWGDGALRSVPIDGSAPPVVIDPLSIHAREIELRITPDGRTVFYLDAEQRLHRAAVDGSSAPARLDGFPDAGSVRFRDYRISPDGARVVYHFQVNGESEIRLLSAPTDGSAAAVQLDPTLRAGRLVDFGAGDRVVFQTPLGRKVRIWSVPADGSAAPTLLVTEDIPQEPEEHGIEVAGERVFYLEIYGVLHSVPVDGHEAPRPVAPGLSAGSLAPVGGRVFFIGVPPGGPADLYSVPADGSAAPVRLSRTQASGYIWARQVTRDGARVVYTHEGDGEPRAIYSTASDGSTEPVRLSAPLAGEEQQLPPDFQLSADGRAVAYQVDTYAHSKDESGTSEVFVVPSDGHAPARRVNEPRPGGSAVLGFHLDRGGRSLLFVSDQDEEYVYELFLAPLRVPGQAQER